MLRIEPGAGWDRRGLIGVIRRKSRQGYRWRLPPGVTELAHATPAMASTTYVIGEEPLTPAAVRLRCRAGPAHWGGS